MRRKSLVVIAALVAVFLCLPVSAMECWVYATQQPDADDLLAVQMIEQLRDEPIKQCETHSMAAAWRTCDYAANYGAIVPEGADLRDEHDKLWQHIDSHGRGPQQRGFTEAAAMHRLSINDAVTSMWASQWHRGVLQSDGCMGVDVLYIKPVLKRYLQAPGRYPDAPGPWLLVVETD